MSSNNIFDGVIIDTNELIAHDTLSFSQPLKNDLEPNKNQDITSIYSLLGYKNAAVLEIARDIVIECFKQGKGDIIISRTGDKEILIYRCVNGEYRNIILDDDGDIEYLNIPVNRSNTYNEYYEFIDINDEVIKQIVTKL